jgi:transcriptional regulator with XRE-family HTH domain
VDLSEIQKRLEGLNWLYTHLKPVGLATLQEAAEACGLDKADLWRYFNGDERPSIDRLPKLWKGLQVSLDELLVALNVHI